MTMTISTNGDTIVNTFDQLRDAVRECTSYDLVQRFSEDDEVYVLIDPYGDQDGDSFYDLDDVYAYITDNEQINDYLNHTHTAN